jgi:hypothetical protein
MPTYGRCAAADRARRRKSRPNSTQGAGASCRCPASRSKMTRKPISGRDTPPSEGPLNDTCPVGTALDTVVNLQHLDQSSCSHIGRPPMARKKPEPKRKARKKSRLPLSVVGLSLSLAGVTAAQSSAPAAQPPEMTPRQELAADLYEEEVFDVTLASFYVFDKENPGGLRRDIGPQLAQSNARRCGRCGGCGISRCARCGSGVGCGVRRC